MLASRDDIPGTEAKKFHQSITILFHGKDFTENNMCEEVELRREAAYKPGFQQPKLIPLPSNPLAHCSPSVANFGQQNRGQGILNKKNASVLKDADVNSFYFLRIVFCHGV